MSDRGAGEPPGAAEPRRYRLSDQERDEAIQALAEAYAEGRLDVTEFEDRMEVAGRAKFAEDLDPLFSDLPRRPRARPLVPAEPARTSWPTGVPGHPIRQGPGPVPGVVGVIVVMAVIALVTTGHFWVLFPAWFLIGHVLHSSTRRRSGCAGRPRS